MPMDYTFHTTVQRVLRQQTKDWAPGQCETREQFKTRLLGAYASLSKETVDKGCAGMAKRLKSLYECNGDATAKD